MILRLTAPIFALATALGIGQSTQSLGEPRDGPGPEGWRTAAPREEIRPEFTFQPAGGHDGKGCFVITHDSREGLHGYWTRTFPI